MEKQKPKIGSHRGYGIHRLGRRNLIAPDPSPKVCRQSILTNCEHLVLSSSSFTKKLIFFKLSIGGISKVIFASSNR